MDLKEDLDAPLDCDGTIPVTDRLPRAYSSWTSLPG